MSFTQAAAHKIKQRGKELAFLIILAVFYLVFKDSSADISRIVLTQKTPNNCAKYKQSCMQLFKKIRFPDPNSLFNPPLSQPPDHLLNEFTQNGEMPIVASWYINEVYNDSSSKKSKDVPIVTKQDLDYWRERVRKNETGNYDDTTMQKIMFKHGSSLKKKTIAVIGTQLVWIEAIAAEASASKITTLDYTRKKYEQNDFLDWQHVNDFLDEAIKHQKIEMFDNAASFSSIEHSGLGRYGDPLNPNGDIEAVEQVHCMLKPGGLFFLGLPSSQDNSSYIEFNAHRYYGTKRLEKLFENRWTLLESSEWTTVHRIYLIKKKEMC